ncbi:cysteine hydrolase family protein [Paenibacillus sp. CF384]|uniref:cysteine hydrolase family protein n=1 Tax=Paenibacillus sp. CF384 TaxID=1884382 RepID=UPI0008975BDB|nr:isochorismatase family cysteine hydrolase [Paenibacillus sp. CF384]SDX07395.1 Nicotinamidase-related amidase [Paenibacillus sp. CF384]
MKIGFLIIDMQTIHLEGLDKQKIERASEYINYVSDTLRSNHQLVIHIHDIEGMTESNRDVFDTVPEIQVQDTDIIVSKESSNAFWQTELEQVLLKHEVELVILAGFAAEQCVLFTYNGASERGFKPVILQNGILSKHHDVITSTYRDRNLISHPVIKYLLN